MAVRLTKNAVEGSTYVVTATFTDENGAAVTPDTVTWTLTDEAGTVVNGREDVSETPAQELDIVLQGDDLEVTEDLSPDRVLTIEATYTSGAGAGLPLKAAAVFTVENLAVV